MTCLGIGYYELLEDSLWHLCTIKGTQEICERIIQELKYYYRWKTISDFMT